MATIRKIHTYVGCFFAPLLLYFTISGAWQIYRLNDLPKDQPASSTRQLLHELSKPHKSSTLPWLNPKEASSGLMKVFSLMLAVGFTATIVLGIQMGLQLARRRRAVLVSLILGVVIPVLLMLIHR